MPLEIERKFLVDGDYKSASFDSQRIAQGYIAMAGKTVVRVRTKGNKAFLTIKSAAAPGRIGRPEWEYEIPTKDALELLHLCHPASVIDKTRYLVREGNHVFEVDEFHGLNHGLVLAEVELTTEDESFVRPQWLGKEVTGNYHYHNSYLSQHPFSEWNKDNTQE